MIPGFPPRFLVVPQSKRAKAAFYLIKLTAHPVHVGGRHHEQGCLIRAKFSDKLCEAADP